jgi:hypothetical protein
MTGTVTATVEKRASAKITKYIIDWLCSAAGAVSATFAELNLGEVSGRFRSCETIPGTNGDLTTNLPDSYSLTITDEYAYDLLEGFGAGRSASAAERINPQIEALLAMEDLTITIASAGNAKRGRIVFVITKD